MPTLRELYEQQKRELAKTIEEARVRARYAQPRWMSPEFREARKQFIKQYDPKEESK